tara:strand:+ start:2472 stop:3329 length:858 start_codon:yes stop_codon:yes gene_type:complete
MTNQDWRTTDYATMEITTNLPKKGCVVDCIFCPQRTLVKSYNGDRHLSLENFKKAIDKIPSEVRITFAGFTEPWTNRHCTDMVLYAHEKGHRISGFTTGVGMTVEDVERLKDIPFDNGVNGGLVLHLPDQERRAKHPITKRYIEVIEKFAEYRNHLTSFYLMSMGTVHEDVRHAFADAGVPEMWSRAGNLIGEAILKPELLNIKDMFKSIYHGEDPKTCGCVEKLYHNVMLPNGDVSLCCMDYSLSYIIGNMFEQEYEEVIPKLNTCYDMCRYCENGVDPIQPVE